MYGLYGVRRWNAPKCHLYDHGQHWVYRVCGRVDLQYYHQRSHVYDLFNMCHRNPCIDGLYNDCQSCLYLVRRRNLL